MLRLSSQVPACATTMVNKATLFGLLVAAGLSNACSYPRKSGSGYILEFYPKTHCSVHNTSDKPEIHPVHPPGYLEIPKGKDWTVTACTHLSKRMQHKVESFVWSKPTTNEVYDFRLFTDLKCSQENIVFLNDPHCDVRSCMMPTDLTLYRNLKEVVAFTVGHYY
ncbi:hypothetical protein BV22DRAFT_834974 [Leucogyrophana mollusca]|uniref:Uncharacterized protein n=1 Tax=Leucogyrophana mollusca TaxID=85980 RepID=A0ACB8B327_9AGAM|nr:hypothetical protein BV22DRAFT_834974 [Leucogyrophana mollusca]